MLACNKFVIIVLYVWIWSEGGSVQAQKDNDTHCEQITVKRTKWHKSLEGIFIKMPAPGHQCDGHNIYRNVAVLGTSYLFFINRTSWKGWMVGDRYCVNKGYLSVGSVDKYPEQINATWEEFDGFYWRYNEDMISGCSHKVQYEPPKPKTTTTTTTLSTPTTRAPTTATTATSTTTSAGSATQPQSLSANDLSIVIYIVVPVGCFAVLVLIVLVLLLYIKSPVFFNKADNKTDMNYVEPVVRWRNQHARLEEEESVITDGGSISGHSRLDQDAPYDYQELCMRGSTGAMRPPDIYIGGYGDKFGSWRSVKSQNRPGPSDAK